MTDTNNLTFYEKLNENEKLYNLLKPNGKLYWYYNNINNFKNGNTALLYSDGDELYIKKNINNDEKKLELVKNYKKLYKRSYLKNKKCLPSEIKLYKHKYLYKNIDGGKSVWYKNGVLHRDNDLPALIKLDNEIIWYKNGHIHRDNDLPAIINRLNDKSWYKNGLLHRDNDYPAVMTCSSSLMWYKNGLLHRDNDLPAVKRYDGTLMWYKNGILQRDNNLPCILQKFKPL